MAMDGNGNNHEPAGTPKGGQFARKAGQGTDDDIEVQAVTAAAGMDALVKASDFEAAGFKVTRDGGDPGEMDAPLAEHDGYTLERDGRKLSVTYGWTGENGPGWPSWQVNTYAGQGNVAYLDGDKPLDVGYLSDDFDRLADGDEDAFESLVEHGTRRDTLDRTGTLTDAEKRQADLLLEQVRANGGYDMDLDGFTAGQCEYVARSEMDRQLDQAQLERHGFRIKPTRGYGKVGDQEPDIRAGIKLERDGEKVSLEYAWEGEDPASAYWCLNTETGDYDELGGYFVPDDLDAETVERNWGVLSSCASHQALEELGCYGVYAVDDYE